ncbi:MAG: photosynthetic reaction center subunit H [Betaproteobacteria bacterium]|jgi:photosynthetic reaction center H subunit|nr:photosynthetic reaction center subunit H [Betaproteobacteria bacterium]NBR97962.1 photosynthetic reaction center subunit H [Betaproteobacteria bacterium]NBS92629.1 photosynthetic reaction center subunit H [Betaproteobacteria bacterium]NBU12965.1 photosynthetic reaction center subunit H [Betaproteobacteria bacterium]NBY52278.1 photosynthetic reaction center subunit H [Betaproteobacteria bacterium]
MGTGAITGFFDVAQLAIYMFWLFFAGLCYYLIFESKREGFPLDSGLRNGRRDPGIIAMPKPKVYRLQHGGEYLAPHDRDWQDPPPKAQAIAGFAGAPMEPTGNPMLDGVGPGAYTNRADRPDMTYEGLLRIVPLRIAAAEGFDIEHGETDPRGFAVLGADGQAGGTVVDLWVDRSEHLFRYIEVDAAGHRVLVPMNLARVGKRDVRVQSLLGSQLAAIPKTANPEQVTWLEEEKIFGYFGGGTLYAEPSRQEPLF